MVPRHEGAGHREHDTGGATGNTKASDRVTARGRGHGKRISSAARRGRGDWKQGRFLSNGV